MGIDVHAPTLFRVAENIPPHRGVVEEEALLRRPTVDLRARFALERLLQRLERDLDPAEIRNVFALGQLALELHAVEPGLTVELLHDSGRARLVALGALRRPPVDEVALGIILSAAVVEA